MTGFAITSTFATDARAGMQTVSYTVVTPTSIPTDFSTTLAVPAFNPALGTLASVTMSFSDGASIIGTIQNTSAAANTFTANEDINFSATFKSQDLTDTLNAFKPYANLGSGSSAAFGLYSLVGTSNMTTITDAPTLATFVGTGTLPMLFQANAVVTVTGQGGNAYAQVTTQAQATLKISYTFSPSIVPEPSSLAMTVLGGLFIAGTGCLRSRVGRRDVSA